MKKMNKVSGLLRYACVFLFMCFCGSVYSANHKGKITVKPSIEDAGTVSIVDQSNPYEWQCYKYFNSGTHSADTKTVTAQVDKINNGYYFSKWQRGSEYYAETPSISITETANCDVTYTAIFAAVTVGDASPASVTIYPTGVSPAAATATATITFTSTGGNNTNDFNYTLSNINRWSITNTTMDGSSVKVTVTYTGTGLETSDIESGFAESVTLTVASAASSGGNSKTATITAAFPVVIGVSSTDWLELKTTVVENASGNAVFDVKYAKDISSFTIPESVTNSTGTWTVDKASATYSAGNYPNGTITVPYIFTHTTTLGTYTADLTLSNAFSTKTATLWADVIEDVGNNVAKVTTAGGVSTMYETWAAAFVAANKADGSTITLLQNIDLGTLTSNQTFTKTTTLDLSGKVLSGEVNSNAKQLLYLDTNDKTLTIMDSKSGGTIRATTADQTDRRAVTIGRGNLILNSGKLSITSTNTEASDNKIAGVYLTSSTATFTMNAGTITADHTVGGGARGVYLAAGAKATLNGGMVEAVAMKTVYGVIAGSSATAESEITVTNATIRATATASAYGIYSYGKVKVTGGVIEATAVKENDKDAGSTAYGIYMGASSNEKAAKCYYGELIMTGGTIHASAATSGAYGILLNAPDGVLSTDATVVDGSHTNKAASIGNIKNVIIFSTTGTTSAYGVKVNGSYNSKTNKSTTTILENVTATVTAGGRYAYGVYADADIRQSGADDYGATRAASVELKNCNFTVKSNTSRDVYGVYVDAVQKTIANTAKGWQGEEYAIAASAVIIGGKYTATASTYAYGLHSLQRVVTKSGKTAYPQLVVNGGTFTAEATTEVAYGLYSGGNTVVDGGEFTATSQKTVRGCYVPSGTLEAMNTTFTATANGTSGTQGARGIWAEARIEKSYAMQAEKPILELNNVTATATTGGNEAYGLFLSGKSEVQTQAEYDALNTTNKELYGSVFYIGEKAVMPQAKINGGTYTATAAGATATGIYVQETRVSATGQDSASGELFVKDATISATTGKGATSRGIQTSGPTEIDKCNITVSGNNTVIGVYVYDKKTKLTNSTITTTASHTARGVYLEANLSTTANIAGWEYIGELESENNTVTATTTGGDNAYGLYLDAYAVNTTAAPAGNYAVASSATLTNDTYTAIASGTKAYAVNLLAPQTKNTATAAPTCTIHSGKFKGSATSTFADVNADGLKDNFLIEQGYFTNKTNVDKYVVEGKAVVDLPSSTTEFGEGYRYFLGQAEAPGMGVCKVITKNATTEYKTLEEALQVVNSDENETPATIVMTNSYTLSAGNYILPAGATLLIPYHVGQTIAKTTTPDRTHDAFVTPFAYLTLTFAEGVNFTQQGVIEVGGKMQADGQFGRSGAITGPYGHLRLEKNARIDVEAGASLYAWGYVTGDGLVNVKKDGKSYEGFQLGDWPGGSGAYTLMNENHDVFPITHYFYQNIESTIIYRAGAHAYGASAVYAGDAIRSVDGMMLVGTNYDTKTDDIALFLLDEAANGENVWIQKSYNPETDRTHWVLNSNTTMSSLKIETEVQIVVTVPVKFNSSEYILPLSGNMDITLNSGTLDMEFDVYMAPGVKLEIAKEAKLSIPSTSSLYVIDKAQWEKYRGYTCVPSYSLNWNTADGKSPRNSLVDNNTNLPSAELFVHGMVEVAGNLFTTASGANIHSTNEDAGKIFFTTGWTAKTNTIYQLIDNEGTAPFAKVYYSNSGSGYPVTSAQLKNGDGSFTQTNNNSNKGLSFNYINDEWVALTEGCISTKTDSEGTHYYANPSDVVELASDENGVIMNGDYTYSDKATGERRFINTENPTSATSCAWWEVKYNEGIDDEGKANENFKGWYASNADFPSTFGGYYEYDDASINCWKEQTVKVRWQYEDGDGDGDGDGEEIATYAHHKGLSPLYLGETPTREADADGTTYTWKGWKRTADRRVYDRNATLPKAITDETYTAEFEPVVMRYTVSFLRYDGMPIQSGLVTAGKRPTPPVTVENYVSGDQEYTFNDKWLSNGTEYDHYGEFPPVTGPVEYKAQYSSSLRKYTVRFVNYDGTQLFADDFTFGSLPVYYGVPPTRESNSAYAYEFCGWKSSTDVTSLDRVTGEETYTAQFIPTPREEFGDWLDVVDAEDTNGSTTQLVLNMNGYTSASGSTGWTITIVDNADEANNKDYQTGDRANDRTLTVDLPTEQQKPDTKVKIIAKDENGVEEGLHKYIVPYVYTADATLDKVATDNSSVIYVKSGTLTVANNVSVAAIYVDPSAELSISAGATLYVGKLVLRTEPYAAAILTDKGRLVANKVYYSRVVNKKGHFPIALPFDVDLKDVVFSHGMKATVGKHFALSYYDAKRRADEGSSSLNWQVLPSNTQKMNAQQAYYFYAPTSTYQEYYFPVAYKQDVADATVEVKACAGEQKHQGNWGWNAVCSPYTSTYACTYEGNPEDGIKISVLQDDNTYKQEVATTIAPATLLFYQTKKDGNLSFGSTFSFIEKSTQSSIAARRTPASVSSAQTQWLQLECSMEVGKTDQTNIYIHPDKFTSAYDIGYDVEKLSTTASTSPLIWSSVACGNLAFTALPDTAAANGIALTVFAPKAGEVALTMLDNQWMNRLSHVYLVDMQENVQVDLLENDYTWMAEAGTSTGRFYLYPILRSPAEDNTVTTLPSQSESEPLVAYAVAKNIIVENVSVGTNVRCFDLSGRLVASCTASTAQVMFAVPASGVYFVHAENGVQKVMVNK